jgi:DNA-binding XRE family transcriptional regulator
MAEELSLRADRLRELRESWMISRVELTRRAGIAALTVTRVEQGRNCRSETKRRILGAFGLSPGGKKKYSPKIEAAFGYFSLISPQFEIVTGWPSEEENRVYRVFRAMLNPGQACAIGSLAFSPKRKRTKLDGKFRSGNLGGLCVRPFFKDLFRGSVGAGSFLKRCGGSLLWPNSIRS